MPPAFRLLAGRRSPFEAGFEAGLLDDDGRLRLIADRPSERLPAEACLVPREPVLRVGGAALLDVLREPDERMARDGALLWLRTLLLRLVDARDARDAGREASGLRRLDAALLSREGLREAPRFNVARPALRLDVASLAERLGLLRSVELERAA